LGLTRQYSTTTPAVTCRACARPAPAGVVADLGRSAKPISFMRCLYSAILIALVGVLSACSTTAPSSTPPKREATLGAAAVKSDGLSYDTAIVIHEKGEDAGVKAEYVWIRANLPGFRPAGQSLQFHEGKKYDVIHVGSASGGKRDVYFDISEFFGNY